MSIAANATPDPRTQVIQAFAMLLNSVPQLQGKVTIWGEEKPIEPGLVYCTVDDENNPLVEKQSTQHKMTLTGRAWVTVQAENPEVEARKIEAGIRWAAHQNGRLGDLADATRITDAELAVKHDDLRHARIGVGFEITYRISF